MFRLNRICSLGKNAIQFRRSGVFRENSPNSSVQTINSMDIFIQSTYFWNRLMNGMQGFQRLPIIASPKDITELYPSATDNLIYLTPDAEHVLHKIEPNHGFIIGAIVDKGDKKPYTLAKAKKLNIKTARLPIEGFVKFRAQKALPFDQVTNILLEAKRSNDWKKAFSHIARRKLM